MKRALRAVGFVIACTGLAWVVVTTSLAAYYANIAPTVALRLAPDHPNALLNATEGRIRAHASNVGSGPNNPSVTADDLGAMRRMVVTALGAQPLNARALRMLGQIAYLEGGVDRADHLMALATEFSPREAPAVLWCMHRSVAAEDYASALYFADVFLRVRPDVAEHALPSVVRMGEIATAAPLVIAQLANNPPWRGQFFAGLGSWTSDTRAPLAIVHGLSRTAHPVQSEEIAPYVAHLSSTGRHRSAYAVWVQALSKRDQSRAGFIFNGDFQSAPAKVPFDWNIRHGVGAAVEIAPLPDRRRERALRLNFGPGRNELRELQQTLLLAPGAYRLKGRMTGRIEGARGVRWRISCLGPSGPQTHAQTNMLFGTAPGWRNFLLQFDVPRSGCRAQILHLVHDARSASEQFMSGSIWFDDLRVDRVAGRPKPRAIAR